MMSTSARWSSRPQSSGRRRHRAFSGDVSLVTEVLYELAAAREGVPVPVDQLPITQGLVLLIADALAEMPIYAVDERNPGVEVWDRFPVLERPNPEEDRATTVHKIVQSLFWTGNAWALTGPGDPTGRTAVDAIAVLDPNTVGPVIDIYDPLRVDHWLVAGRERDRSEVAHWRMSDDPRRGPLGESPLRRCAVALGLYGWAYRYLADYFSQGGNPSAYLKSDLELSDAEARQHADDWVAARRARRNAVLPRHLTFEVPPVSGDQAAALEVLNTCSAEVARMLGVPPSLANAPTIGYSLTYSNVGDEFRRWLAISLGPTWISRVERGFTALLPRGWRARLDRAELFDEIAAVGAAVGAAGGSTPAAAPPSMPMPVAP